jgi:hypothetical protein
MTVLIVTYYSSPGPSASQSAGRGYVNPFFCVAVLVENHRGIAIKSPIRTEDSDQPLDHPICALKLRVRAYRFLDASMVFNRLRSPSSC